VYSSSRFVVGALRALLAACAGGSSPLAPYGAEALLAPAVMKTASASEITVDPGVFGINTLQTAGIIAEDHGNTEKYTSTSTGPKACHNLVTSTPRTYTTRELRMKVTAGAKTGTCEITFAATDHHTAQVTIIVKPEPTSALFGGS